MRLKKIKLSGFKSFVDPITIPISGNLIGIVGPNGCGKSNIIDAVRWVMGESSAKNLRGESMADVIFSGSNARKPVGKASVELVFDNSDGRAGGQYADYAEISIRREAGRDGLSDYFLNKGHCRRKDITDIFLGTGIGPRTYSIIEQGMVARIIEAKPEELRGFFEEAAGISKYKERRRETENRIRHTRENLSRVEDIRKEMETQINRLQRQSRAAKRYKELKEEERLLRAQLLGLRWRDINARLEEREAALGSQETAVEAVMAAQRAVEAEIETIRSRQTDASDHFNGVQAEFYSLGTEISGIEQAIQHAQESRQQRQQEFDQVAQSWNETNEHLQADTRRINELTQRLDKSAPALEQSRSQRDSTASQLAMAEQAMHDWQGDWQSFNEIAAEPAKVREIQNARIQQLEQHVRTLQERQERLEQEANATAEELRDEDVDALRKQSAEVESNCEQHEQKLKNLDDSINGSRHNQKEITSRLETLHGRQQTCDARLESLQEMQAAAQGKHDTTIKDWLKQRSLDKAPRLTGMLSVDSGWEKAVERVLGIRLAAVCVPDIGRLSGDLKKLKNVDLAVFDLSSHGDADTRSVRPTLLKKIESKADLTPLLSGIYVAENLADALSLRASLAQHESVITPNGEWIGVNWLSLTSEGGARAGMLGREREIEHLTVESTKLHKDVAQTREELIVSQDRLQELEDERDQRRRDLNELQRERTAFQERLVYKEALLMQFKTRREQLRQELDETLTQRKHDEEELAIAKNLLAEAEGKTGTHEQQRVQLTERKDALQEALQQARAAAGEAQEKIHQFEIERQGYLTAVESTRGSIARLETQLQQLSTRRNELEEILTQDEQPGVELKQRLEELLQKRLDMDEKLKAARQAHTDLETHLREQEHLRGERSKEVQEMREELETERVARQELLVRRQTFDEQLYESGYERERVLAELPPEAEENAWHERLEKVETRINRLGAINFVAIEEYNEQSERKNYLDKQYDDLTQALATLEEAIHKIDRVTRLRFKETFEKINEGFRSFFPRLFGGGSAYLEMTENDLLNAGVTVMARPPGKRNSTIHLLSGGEKALTAVSLVFAIFQLNPAPFCLLDEVDAPLDDTNVERYCETLKTMTQKTQLVYVTHNKISMEMADYLIGVTMSEPGVSRLVSVDIEEALEMAVQ